jgi:VanZ family protein
VNPRESAFREICVNPRLVRLLFVWGPAALMMAVLFAASSASDTSAVPAVFSDKVLHLGAYALLGITVFHAFADGRFDRVTSGRAILAVLFCILYGISDEFHQSFVPGRTPDAKDLIADGVGAALGAAFLLLVKTAWLRNRRTRSF